MTFGENEIVITKAIPSDIDNIKQIADAHRNELGFVRRPSLLEAINRSEVNIVKVNGNVLGFLEYRHRKDEQTTLYSIAIVSKYRSRGIGRKLVQSLVKEAKQCKKGHILLKCPEDLAANNFYKKLGFKLLKIENGRQRKLNVWQLDLL